MLPREIVTGSLLTCPTKVSLGDFPETCEKMNDYNDCNDWVITPFASQKYFNSSISIKLEKDLREQSANRSSAIFFLMIDNSCYFWHITQEELKELSDVNITQLLQAQSTYLYEEGFQH